MFCVIEIIYISTGTKYKSLNFIKSLMHCISENIFMVKYVIRATHDTKIKIIFFGL